MIRFENKTNGRFYYMAVENDDSNTIVLRIIRGGRHVRVSHDVTLPSRMAAYQEIDRLSKRRIKRGYSLVTS